MDFDVFKRMMWLRRLYLKAILPLPFPLILNIEPTNRCNLACRMCPRSFSSRPLVDLEWPRFERLCGELKTHGPIQRVFLQKDGEPLLHPRIVDMVALLHQNRAARSLAIITNGTLLSEKMFSNLANAGLNDLIISIDAVDDRSYKELKGVDSFHKVVLNVQQAARIKKQNGWRFPLIKTRMVARSGHDAEIEQFRRQWTGIADAIDITPFHTWIGAIKDERCYQSNRRYPCALLWYTGVINADGAVSPCCIDYNQKGIFAHVDDHRFFDIWNGKALRQLRHLHLHGQYDRTAICGPCEYWQIKEDLAIWLRRKYCIAGTA